MNGASDGGSGLVNDSSGTCSMQNPYAELQIVIPVYNDWESVAQLLPMLDAELSRAGVVADVVLTNDGSQRTPPTRWEFPRSSIQTIRILHLRRNLGHQRAICISLCHLNQQADWQRVLIMDGDGEDSPSDVARLLAAMDDNPETRVVFAERTKRSEGYLFSFFYFLYRMLHLILVGHRVRVGNFSVMNRRCLQSLCVSWELWNHYAAAVFASRQRIDLVPTARGKRLAGRSQMKLPDLVMHGLSALSVFYDRISTRLLMFSAAGTLVAIVGLVAVLIIRLTTEYAIPGWATNAFGILVLLLVQIVAFMLTSCLVVLFTRGLSQFVPARDFEHFVFGLEVFRLEETSRDG